jgi:alcohol dehydrogenase (NADP+)
MPLRSPRKLLSHLMLIFCQSACVVGHEIVGTAVRVGKNVSHIKPGDRVGVGAQARSCMQSTCPDCSSNNENYCTKGNVSTYGSIYPNDEGKSYGGYADYNRTNGHFVVPIPEGLDSVDAAPMLCGGITVFSPLKHNGCGPGKAVGVVGVGGLGHFAVLFAKALGADRVVGISRKGDKKEDVMALGADAYIATDEDKDWETRNMRSLDLIISTVSSASMPLTGYLGLLKTRGTLIQVGAPDGGNLPPINAFTLLVNGIKIGGSGIGSPSEISEMLQLAADKKIKPWVQTRPLREANQTVVDMGAGKARFRYVLVNENYGKH